MDDLIQRLPFAENDFLTALESGSDKLSSYSHAWSAFPDILHTASKTGSVSDETSRLAHTVASRIAYLAGCFLDIRRKEESFSTSLQRDCDAMLHQMAALDLNGKSESLPLSNNNLRCAPSHSITPVYNAHGSFTPLLTAAYRWLLDNLHNPYPTTEVKVRIAATSSCQVSSVNSWFTNARRRIGWTALCRERFSNCRADMIDAAHRAFVEEDPQRTLPLGLRHSFMEIKVAAEGLHAPTFARSAFDLDAVVNDTRKESESSAELETSDGAERVEHSKEAPNPYPSPDRSDADSPLPVLGDSLTDTNREEIVPPPIHTGSKRSHSCIEAAGQSYAERPIKRLRASATSQTRLPSPPSSTNGIDELSDEHLRETSPVHCTQPETTVVLSSLSEANASGTQSGPRSPVSAAYLRSGSDPLPRSNVRDEYSIDDWFKTNFDSLFAIPPPADITELDSTASWEVGLFKDYSTPQSQTCAPADTLISVQTAPSNLDYSLQSIGNDPLALPHILSQSNATGSLPISSFFDPSISDFSSVDWTALLNSQDTYQPTAHSTYLQQPANSQPLTEIDLPVLQLPYAVPAVNCRGGLTSKEAKLHQYLSMQEAVRRMERELLSEGIVP